MYMTYNSQKDERTSICAGTIDWWQGKDEGLRFGEGDEVVRLDIWLKEKAPWLNDLNPDGKTKFETDSEI